VQENYQHAHKLNQTKTSSGTFHYNRNVWTIPQLCWTISRYVVQCFISYNHIQCSNATSGNINTHIHNIKWVY